MIRSLLILCLCWSAHFAHAQTTDEKMTEEQRIVKANQKVMKKKKKDLRVKDKVKAAKKVDRRARRKRRPN